MRIQINNSSKCDTFVSIFQHLKQFTEHINIRFSEEEMFIQSMDAGRVLIFEIQLPAEWFNAYELGTGSTTIGIHTSLLYKILNVKEKNQEIVLSTKDNEYLSIQLLNSPIKEIFDKQFEIPLLDLNYELMEIPEFDHQAEVSLASTTFATLINQLRIFGESVTIQCSEETIQLTADSIEGKMTTNIPIDDLDEFAIEENKHLQLTFALKHIHDICLYHKIAKHIYIGISENYPMNLKYNISSENKNARMSFE